MIFFKIAKNYLIILKYKLFKITNYYYHEFLKSVSYDLKQINSDHIKLFLETNKVFKKEENKIDYSNLMIELVNQYKQGQTIELINYKSRINKYDEPFSWSKNYLLSKLFFFIGITSLSFYHRNLYKNFFLNSKFINLKFYEKIEYFKVLFENGKEISENKNYIIFLKSFILNFFFKSEAKSIKLINKVLSKEVKIQVKKDSFFNLLINKSIAILGPANNKELDFDEIKKFDLIIQPNVFNKDQILFPDKTISYYSKFSTGRINDRIKQNNFDFLYELQFICTKSYSKEISEKIKNSRNFDNKINIVSGSEQLLQHILNDIIQYKPKKIKLFSADFYLNPTNYDKIYSGNDLRNLDDLQQSRQNQIALSYHDLFSQFNHIKTFHNLGYLELDKFTGNIINLTEIDLERKILNRYKDVYKSVNFDRTIQINK